MDGGVGGVVLVSGARVVDEVSEGGEVIGIEGSHSLGEKAVEQSGGAGLYSCGQTIITHTVLLIYCRHALS